jgi:cytochrome c-type biogenesis protein CcmH/NrfF
MNKTTKTILWLVVAIIVILGGIWYGVSRKPTTPTTLKGEPMTGDRNNRRRRNRAGTC